MANDIYGDTLEDQQQPPKSALDQILAQEKQVGVAKMRVVEQETFDITPDRAADARRLAAKTGQPIELVTAHFDEFAKKQSGTPYADIMRQTPALAEFLQTPNNAAVAKDDLEPLGFLEWLTKAPIRAVAQGNAMQDVANLRFAEMMGTPLTPAQRNELAVARSQMELGGALGTEGHWFRGAITGGAAQLPILWGIGLKGAERSAMAVPVVAGLSAATGGIGAPAAVAGGITVGMAAGAMEYGFMLEAGLAYDEFLDIKDEFGQPLAPEVARMAAFAAGSANAGLEVTGAALLARTIRPLKTLTQAATRGAIKTALKSPTVRQALLDMAKTYTGAVAGEALVEGGQRANVILAGEAGKRLGGQEIPEKKTWSEAAREVAQEVAHGAQAFSLLALPGPSISAATDVRRAKQARDNETWFKALGEGVTQSKTAQRSPEALQEMMGKATAGGPIKDVFAPLESWDTYWQSKSIDPAKMAEEVTGNPRAYADAQQTGTLEMPTANYAARLAGTEHNTFFAAELRLGDPEAMNARESKAFDEEQKAIEQREAAAAAENPVLDQVQTQIEQQLETALAASGIKIPQGWSKDNAQVWRSLLDTFAQQEGVDPVEMLVEYVGGILGPNEQERSSPQQGDSYSQADPMPTASRHGLTASAAAALRHAGFDVEEPAPQRRETDPGFQPAAAASGVSTETSFTPEAQRRMMLEDVKDFEAVKQGRNLQRRLGEINANRIPEPTRDGSTPAVAQRQRTMPINDVAMIADYDSNPFKGEEYLAALQAQIAAEGILQPLNVWAPKDEPAQLQDGHHRLRAAIRLGLDTVPIQYVDDDGVALPDEDAEFFQTKAGDEFNVADLTTAPALTQADGSLIVSTRLPSGPQALKADSVLVTTLDVAKTAPGDYMARVGAVLRGKVPKSSRRAFPQLSEAERKNLSDAELVDRLVDVMSENLHWLWEIAEPWRDRAKLWYVGANRISLDMVEEFSILPRQAAGVLAVLSPQMDWFKNVDLAYRVAHTFRIAERDNPVFSGALLDAFQKRKIAAAKKAKDATPESVAMVVKDVAHLRKQFIGRRWSQLSDFGQAVLLRELDEAEGMRKYRVITPEGGHGDWARKKPDKKQREKALKLGIAAIGDPAKVGWGTYKFIGNAISILRDGSVENISFTLGGEHKVRSFYNNISDPSYRGSVTVDTHAVAANTLMPLAGGSHQVQMTMAGPGSNPTGLSGINAVMAEAYFRVAEELGVLPREVQSVTWEAVRLLFKPEQKRGEQGKVLTALVDKLWSEVTSGNISVDDFRQRLLEASGGLGSPDWFNSGSGAAGDQGNLLEGDARGRTAADAARRGTDGGGAAGRPGGLAGGLRQRLHRGRYRRRVDGAVEPANAEAEADEEQEFFQTQLEPAPIFYSRLLAAVRSTPMQSAPGFKWKGVIAKWAKAAPTPTLGKSWLEGINQHELAITHVDDLVDGKTYTKQEVLDYLSVREVLVSEVILGAPTPAARIENREQRILRNANKRYRELVDERIAEAESEGLEGFEGGAEFDNVADQWQATVNGEPIDDAYYDDEDEAIRSGEEVAERMQRNQDEEVRLVAQEQVDWGDVMADARADETERGEDPDDMRPTQFDEYVELGGDPGSYREAFVVVEELTEPGIDAAALEAARARVAATKANVDEAFKTFYALNGELQTLQLANKRVPIEFIERRSAAIDHERAMTREHMKASMVLEGELSKANTSSWVDGHTKYSDIDRPIVRLRFDSRSTYAVDATGKSAPKRTMFLQEVQPPGRDQFRRMPELFQKNWREIAFKWALRYAADNGFDVVAWTTGEMQAKRYRLSQAVRQIGWHSTKAPGAKALVSIELQTDAILQMSVSADGKVLTSPDAAQFVGQHVDEVVGKDIAAQILGLDTGQLRGDGLNIGGEGLTKLYDKDFPAVVGNLPAVRRSKAETSQFALSSKKGVVATKTIVTDYSQIGGRGGRVKTTYHVVDPDGSVYSILTNERTAKRVTKLRQQELDALTNVTAGGPTVPGVEITPALREAVTGGQTLFQDGGEKQGSTRGRFGKTGGDRRFWLRLFKSADASTFMHESAHIWLEMMRDLERRPQASDRIKNDMGLLREWWFGPGGEGEITEAQHEQFARAFELYLLEGKAPSLSLQNAFSNFRAWLLRFYQSLTAQVTLTDDVRGVFDRMLATDQAIADAKAQMSATPMFTTLEGSGMTPEVYAAYVADIAEASRVARETLESKALRQVRRAQTLQWKEAEDETAEEVRSEVHQRPAYQAIAAMRTGKRPDGSQIVEGVDGEALRLSRQIIVDRYGAERLRTLPRMTYAREGGLDPDVVGQMFGFSSGDQMLQAVAAVPPMQQAIKAEVAQRMQQRFGDMVLDGSLSDEARAAVANDNRDRIVRAEMRALSNLRSIAAPFVAQGEQAVAGERAERAYERRWFEAESKLRIAIEKGYNQLEIEKLRQEVIALRRRARGGAAAVRGALPSDDTVRQLAEDRINRTRVRDIKPQAFWMAARQASQKATELAAVQDFEGAIKAKQQELINLALFRRASSAISDADDRVRRAMSLSTPAARARLGRAGANYQDQVDGILDRYDFARVSQKALDRKQALRAWIAELGKDGMTVALPESVLDEARRINHKDLTISELIDVTDSLQQIVHLASLKNRLLKAKQQRELQATIDQLVASIKDNATRRAVKRIETHLPQDEAGREVGIWFAAHRKMSSLAREMDGLVDGGPMVDAVIAPLNAAADREAVMNAAATTVFGDLVRTAYPGREKGKLYQPQHIPAIGAELTRMGQIMVALHWGNAGNRQSLMSGYGWTEAQVQAILDMLDARDLTFVQGVFDAINVYWPEIEAKELRVTGLKPAKVDAVPFTAKAGAVAGGYFPKKWDGRQSESAQKLIDVEKARIELAAEYVRSTTARGHTKERVEQTGPEFKLRLDFGVITEHVKQVIHDLSHHETLIDVNRILGHAQLRGAIFDHYGDSVYNQFKNGVKAVAVGQVNAVEPHEKRLNHFRIGTTVAFLGWNLTTVMLQPLGLTQSMRRVGIKWVAKGLWRWLDSPSSMVKTVEWINTQSDFMKLRGQTQQREINEIRNDFGLDTGKFSGWLEDAVSTLSLDLASKQGLVDSYFYLIQQTQRIADVPTWLGQYEKAMAAGETEDRAIQQADQAVRDAQGSGQLHDLAAVQRGGPAWKTFTNFYSFFSTTFNQSAESIAQGRFKKPGYVGRMAVDYLLLYTIPATLGYILREAMKPDGAEDDDENFLLELAKQNASYMSGTMIGMRELSGVIQGAYGYEGPSGARAFAEASKLLKQIGQGELDVSFWKALNNTAGIVFHYPAGQVRRTIEGLVAIIEGRTSNPFALVSGPPKEEP